MADILLFGPPMAGKTQLYHSLRGQIYNNPQQTGDEEYKVVKFKNIALLLRWIRGWKINTIREIGGKDKYLYDKEFLHKVFEANSKLVFVFNGNDFIKELENFKCGGLISALLRCYVMPALGEDQRDIFFIATHNDEYEDPEMDMETKIFTCLESANEEYRIVANGTRYPFKKLLRGNLYCVNAMDQDQVRRVFESINKSL